MKALLYKDAMVLWKQMKLMLLLILIFAVIPSEFQNTFAVLYAALLPYSALAYDERSRWDRMAAAMPYSARDIVTEKYVFGWIAALGTLALTLVLRLVSQHLLHLGEGASAEMLLMAFFGSLIAMAVTLPLMFRFGVEKGRLAMLLLILVFAVFPSEFQNVFAVLYAALLPYSALAYDERSRWDRMAAAMPYSARDIVTEKYVFGWIAALGTLALTLVLRLVSQYLLHLGEGASAEMLLMAFFGSLIAMAVTLPMMFRFGVEKGRLAMLLLIGLICGGAAGVAGMETFAVGSVQNLPVLLLAAALAIAVNAVSLPIAVRCYAAREKR